MSKDRVFLWVNLSDLSALGIVGGTTSPLTWMLMDGDELLPEAYMRRGGNFDDAWVIVETNREGRAGVLEDALKAIATAKKRGRLRIRITARRPGASWKWIPG